MGVTRTEEQGDMTSLDEFTEQVSQARGWFALNPNAVSVRFADGIELHAREVTHNSGTPREIAVRVLLNRCSR